MGRLTMKIAILLFINIISNVKLISQELTDSIKYDYNKVMQIKGVDKRDTTFINRCIERKAKIFVNGRKYIYKASILNGLYDTLCLTHITLIGSNQRWKNEPKKQMTANYVFERFFEDSLKLQKYIENSQCFNWLNSTNEGVIENVEKIWIHPFRSNQYVMTEIVGFPDVLLPLEIGKEWTGNLYIQNGWCNWENKEVKNHYNVLSKEEYVLNNQIILCWKIIVNSSIEQNENKLTYLFNEQNGFVSMKYEFYNGLKINFEMIKTINENEIKE